MDKEYIYIYNLYTLKWDSFPELFLAQGIKVSIFFDSPSESTILDCRWSVDKVVHGRVSYNNKRKQFKCPVSKRTALESYLNQTPLMGCAAKSYHANSLQNSSSEKKR